MAELIAFRAISAWGKRAEGRRDGELGNRGAARGAPLHEYMMVVMMLPPRRPLLGGFINHVVLLALDFLHQSRWAERRGY